MKQSMLSQGSRRTRRAVGPLRLLPLLSATILVTILAFTNQALARRNGIAAPGCDGCHNGGAEADVTLTFEPANFEPGETVTATVSIEAQNGSSAGVYLLASTGRFSLISGQNTALYSEKEITHSSPKAASGGTTVFQVRWTAPTEPSGVYLEAFALSANGNGSAGGDGPGYATATAAFGCSGGGAMYYPDFDGDGYAGDVGIGPALRSCSKPVGYAEHLGDCNDNDQNIHAGAIETCNRRDDNCDGEIDEGLATDSVILYEDKDGDGFGTASGAMMTSTGCARVQGYSSVTGDCRDSDPAVHPDAEEVCNLVDDNCDGRVDERVRPRCGVGMCERLSTTCSASNCIPGEPAPEMCNWLDDDCDGLVDNGAALCSEGQTCEAGRCGPTLPPGTPGTAGATSTTAGMAQGAAAGEPGMGGMGGNLAGSQAGNQGAGTGGSTSEPPAITGSTKGAGCAFRGMSPDLPSSSHSLLLASALIAGTVRRRRFRR